MLPGLKRLFAISHNQSDVNLSKSARIYHYRVNENDEKCRVHLRIDPDGLGTLIVNANRVIHLNPTAALMAHQILEKNSVNEAVKAVR